MEDNVVRKDYLDTDQGRDMTKNTYKKMGKFRAYFKGLFNSVGLGRKMLTIPKAGL